MFCVSGASEYHMLPNKCSQPFLLMGQADITFLEISVPASEINSNRAGLIVQWGKTAAWLLRCSSKNCVYVRAWAQTCTHVFNGLESDLP